MATYQPAEFPRRPKQSTPFNELKYQAQLAYYKFEIDTGQYVMSPGEKITYNLVFLICAALFFSAIYFDLPRSFIRGLQHLVYYSTGSPEADIVHVLQTRDIAVLLV